MNTKEKRLDYINKLLQKYFPVFLLAGILLGISSPDTAFALKPYILVCLSILVFYPALKIDFNSLVSSLKMQAVILIFSVIILFGLIPLLIYFIGSLTGLDKQLLVGLVLASAAPSMLSATYFTNLVDGNLETSLSISIISTLLSPLVLPVILLVVGGKETGINVFAVGEISLYVIAIPIAIAILMRRVFPKIVALLLEVEQIITTPAIILPNWIIIGTNANMVFGSAVNTLLPLFIIGLIQVFGVFFLTRKVSKHILPDKISKTLAVCFGLKNVALVGGIMVTLDGVLSLPSGIIAFIYVLMYIMISIRRDKI